MSNRIRWEPAPSYSLAAFVGRTGSNDADVFKIFTPDMGEPDWILNSALPGWDNCRGHGNDPDALKAEAERWLEEFVSSLGAVFEDDIWPPLTPVANPEPAKEAGR